MNFSVTSYLYHKIGLGDLCFYLMLSVSIMLSIPEKGYILVDEGITLCKDI